MRGKSRREKEREPKRHKCVRNKRFRGNISVSLSLSLSFFFSSILFVFFFSLLFLVANRARTVFFIFSIFPRSLLSRWALCTVFTSRVKLCATSLTFDNRCSSGNYSPVLAANLHFHFALVFSLETNAFPRPSSFCPQWTSKCNPREAKIPSRVLTPIASASLLFPLALHIVAEICKYLFNSRLVLQEPEGLVKPTDIHFELLQQPTLSESPFYSI